MKSALALMASLLLAACQAGAYGGSIVSDGRTTTVRQSSIEAGTETGVRSRSSETVIRPGSAEVY